MGDFMKIERLKNRVLSIGKLLSIVSIIVTISTYVSEVFVYIVDHSGTTGIDLWWLSDISLVVFSACLYVCMFVLPVIFVSGIILTVIIAFKNHKTKELLDLRFLVILIGMFLTLGLGWLWLPEFFEGLILCEL